MFGFKRKYNVVQSGLLRGMRDIHAHILPGVDDGAATATQSLEILDYLAQLGFREVWFTPHVMEDCPGNTPEALTRQFEAFRTRYAGPLSLRLSSEYMLDALFPDRLQTGLLPLGDKRHLLVETSYMFSPPDLDSMLLDICKAGYTPVIAHPERYGYMSAADHQALKEKGYAFQLNLMSLSGYYGTHARRVGEQLLEAGSYNYIGTDLHHLERYQPMLDSFKLSRRHLDLLAQLIENNNQL